LFSIQARITSTRNNDGNFSFVFTKSLNKKEMKGKVNLEDALKVCVGIDVAKDENVCCLSYLDRQIKKQVVATRVFKNTRKGFELMLKWEKTLVGDIPGIRYVCEATGVYHEALCDYLFDNHKSIRVVLPSKISNFRKSLDVKMDDDFTAAEAISIFGLTNTPKKWQKPNPVYRKLRDLTRERHQLTKNRIHACKHSTSDNKTTIDRLLKIVKMYEKTLADLEKEIKAILNENKELKQKLELVCTIKGVGLISATTVIAETNGFELFENKRQLISYVGLDVINKQSGTSVRTKPRISKRGNKNIRRALYFPSLSAARNDDGLKKNYLRIAEKTSIKMKGLVSVQRKLLVLIYTIWKKNEEYDPEYYKKSGEPSLARPTILEKTPN
jgi:transposase